MSATLISDKLKAALLQAAIQGKLTQQLPEDGDARDLLKQIEAEKERLINEKVIKKEKPLPEITEDEIPFDIPDNWVWVRLQDIFNIVRGGSPRPIQQFITKKNNGINWIKIGDTDIGGKYINDVREKIIPEGIKSSRFVHKGDLLLTNSMSYGRPYILNVDGCIHDGWLAFSPYIITISKEFFYYLLSSYFIKNQFNNTVSGAVVKNLNRDKVKEVFIPLPPITEQHRIVEAIEKALAKIDKLKVDETKLYNIQKAFPTKLRASLLQSAIQGKLTQQLPEDGDARDLLKQIKAEKERLINEKIIKKEKPLPEITEDEIPFDIPNNWVWVRLGNVILKNIGGGTPNKSNLTYWNGDIFWASVKDLNVDEIHETQDKITQEGLDNSSSNLIPKDTYVICTRMGLGKISLTQVNVAINQDLRALFFSNNFCKKYFYHFYKTLVFKGKGATVKGISVNQLNSYLFPLPPLAEQQRIVEVIETALAKIDKLNKLTE